MIEAVLGDPVDDPIAIRLLFGPKGSSRRPGSNWVTAFTRRSCAVAIDRTSFSHCAASTESLRTTQPVFRCSKATRTDSPLRRLATLFSQSTTCRPISRMLFIDG